MILTNQLDERAVMPRTKTFRSDQVIDRAMHLFWTKGYGATSIEELAQVTGLSRSSLYAEYASKRGLFSAAVNHYLGYFDELLTPLSGGDLDSVQAFFEGIAIGDDDHPPGCLMVNAMTELGSSDADFTDDADLYRAMIKDAFSSALATAEEEEQIDPGAGPRRAELLTTHLLGLFVLLRSSAHRAEIDASVGAIEAEVRSWRRLSLKQRISQQV